MLEVFEFSLHHNWDSGMALVAANNQEEAMNILNNSLDDSLKQYEANDGEKSKWCFYEKIDGLFYSGESRIVTCFIHVE